MSIAVKSGLPSLGSTEGAVISADEVSVSEDGSAAASVGEDLPRGKSAYEIAKENGFNGTEAEWLASLKGEPGAAGASGKDGENGKTPYVGDNGNWYIGADDTGKPSRGAKGEKGEKGDTGAQGIQGEQGIQGVQGEKGDKGEKGAQGPQGLQGPPGEAGADGKTPYVGDNGNWFVGSDDTGKPSRGEKGEPGSPGAKGDKGDPGATPNLTIGSVTTLEAGQNATASMGGTAESPVLNLGIPRGAKGEPGEGGGGTDISLGLTSAAVGQTIKVKAIDESGKPTAWEAANMPSGGGGAYYRSWSKVWTLVVAEDIAGFEASNINLDGKSEIMIVFISDSTASRTMTNGRIYINGVDAGKMLFNTLPLRKDSHSFVIIGRADEGIEYTTMQATAEYQTYPWQGEVKVVHRMVSGVNKDIQWIAGSTIKITQGSATLGKGVTIEIYVR